jgi:hypothetical protein
MNEKVFPKSGKHTARRSEATVIFETTTGGLAAAIMCEIIGGDVAFSFRHNVTLISGDGSPQQKSIEALKTIWPEFDGVNVFQLEDIALAEEGVAEFELSDCFVNNSYIPAGESEPVEQFKSRWLNPIGGGMNKPSQIEDRKSVINKWSSKLKAINKSATTPAKASVEEKPGKKTSSPPAKAAAKAPPSRKTTGVQARTSTQEEVWNALAEANPDEDEAALGKKYYAVLDELFNGEADLTPVQWGAVADKLEV